MIKFVLRKSGVAGSEDGDGGGGLNIDLRNGARGGKTGQGGDIQDDSCCGNIMRRCDQVVNDMSDPIAEGDVLETIRSALEKSRDRL